jgi:hypothetical protein
LDQIKPASTRESAVARFGVPLQGPDSVIPPDAILSGRLAPDLRGSLQASKYGSGGYHNVPNGASIVPDGVLILH